MRDELANIDDDRLVLPGLGGLYRSLAPLSYVFVRIVVGIMVAWPGYEKVFQGGVNRIAAGNVLKTGLEPAWFWAWAAGLTELTGGVLLILGLFTRPAAFALAIVLGVITFKVQWSAGFFWSNRGYEVALMMMLAYVAYVIGGGGRYSLDRSIGREF